MPGVRPRQAEEGATVASPPHHKWSPRNNFKRHHSSKVKQNSRSPVLSFFRRAIQQPGRSPSVIHEECCHPRPVTVVYVKSSSSHRQQHCISPLTFWCPDAQQAAAPFPDTNVALPFESRSQRWSACRTRRRRRTSSEHCRAGGS